MCKRGELSGVSTNLVYMTRIQGQIEGEENSSDL
jgi:hypothetical protein